MGAKRYPVKLITLFFIDWVNNINSKQYKHNFWQELLQLTGLDLDFDINPCQLITDPQATE